MHEDAIPRDVHIGIETLEECLKTPVYGRQQAEVKREGERAGLRSATAPTTYWSDAPDEKPHRDPAYLPAYNPRRVSGASYRPYAGDSEWTLAANAAMKVASNANYPI